MKEEQLDHYDVASVADMEKLFPRPWRLGTDQGEIVAANGEPVIITDCGYYPPGPWTAKFIVAAVNGYKRLGSK